MGVAGGQGYYSIISSVPSAVECSCFCGWHGLPAEFTRPGAAGWFAFDFPVFSPNGALFLSPGQGRAGRRPG